MINYYYIIEILVTLPIVNETLLCVIDVRTKKWIARLFGSLAVLFTIVSQEFMMYQFNMSIQETYRFSFFTSFLPYFIVFFLLSKHKNLAFIFSYTTVHILAASTTTISYLLSYLLFKSSQIAETIIHSLLLLALFFLFKKLFGRKYFIATQLSGHKWALYLFLPVLVMSFWMIYNTSPARLYDVKNKVFFPYLGYNYIEDIPALLTLQIIIFYMAALVLIIILITYTINKTQYEQYMLKMQSKHFQKQIDNMLDNEAKIKVIRHDIRHHMQTLYQILESEDIEKAKEYVSEFSKIIPEVSVINYTGNTTVDLILSLYEKRCKENEIKLKIACDNISVLGIPDTELASVVSNLLENAFIAVQNVEKEKAIIDFRFLKKNKQFLLSVSNTYTGTVELDENKRPITRRKGHGIGTLSIQEFATKYNASVSYDAKNNYFKVNMLVRQQEETDTK